MRTIGKIVLLCVVGAVECQADDQLYMVIDLSDSSKYPVSYLSSVPTGGWGAVYKTTKMVLRKVPAGVNAYGDFCVTNDQYVGVFEVTQKQWKLVTGGSPSAFTGEKNPVECVYYNNIRSGSSSFLALLRARTGIAGFDLPTYQQWDYASTAGVVLGKHTRELLYVSSWNSENSGSKTHEVGTKRPNAWGIYDLFGNVEEWTLDESGYSEGYYLTMGGSWDSVSIGGACRNGSGLFSYDDMGFRVYLTMSEVPYHTVVYDLGGKGRRTGGGELLQVVEHGTSATPPTVCVDSSLYSFSGWDVSGDVVDDNMVIHAVYDLVSSDITVDRVAAAQRYPWNGKVDIRWQIGDSQYSEGCTYAIALSAIDVVGKTNLSVAALVDSMGVPVAQPFECAGTNGYVVWDAEADLPDANYNVSVKATAVPTVRKTGTPILPGEYLVIDVSGGPAAASFPVSSLDYTDAKNIPSGGWSDEYKTTKIVLRKIFAGTDPCGRYTLTKDYYAGVFEITQKQWEQVGVERTFGFYGYYPKDANGKGSTYPEYGNNYNTLRGSKYGKSWPASSAVDAGSFIGVLRAKTGLTGLDLPTVAQWDYASRAGDAGPYGIGSCSVQALDAHAWHSGNAGRHAHPVGTKLPNAWGLYDTLGNVAELCLDWWDNTLFYESSYTGTDPRGADGTDAAVVGDLSRAMRGGSQCDSVTSYGLLVNYSNALTAPVTSAFAGQGFRLFCNIE